MIQAESEKKKEEVKTEQIKEKKSEVKCEQHKLRNNENILIGIDDPLVPEVNKTEKTPTGNESKEGDSFVIGLENNTLINDKEGFQ